ncbi:MAG: type II toxin-antitoxin system RelE/ParE family toxin [Candidatus Symbiobacter sp.]|nr:type II toxin-antitoxin system RelE/ParE family toxin [Candidatus Symbiobacter sp.]
MRIWLSKEFSKFKHREKISDQTIRDVVAETARGIVTADLSEIGSEIPIKVYKQRLSRPGQGKRQGYRVILFYHAENYTLFLEGWAKRDSDDLAEAQKRAYRVLIKRLGAEPIDVQYEFFTELEYTELVDKEMDNA